MSDILNCGRAKQKSELVRFTYQCPKSWQNLQVTENDSVRFCDACQENVYYCTDKQEAEQHARKGHCIAIASELTTAVDEQCDDAQYMFMGIVQVKTRPEHTEAWGKDIFDRQKHQLVKAIRDRTTTVAEINYKDLSHVDLSGVDLSYADLSSADLFNTNLRKTSSKNRYNIENLDSDRKRLLAIIDRHNNRSDKTLNLSPYSQKLLQERESNRLEVEQLIEKITEVLIFIRCV